MLFLYMCMCAQKLFKEPVAEKLFWLFWVNQFHVFRARLKYYKDPILSQIFCATISLLKKKTG